MDKLSIQIRYSSNTSIYIVTTNKIIGLNSYLLQSLPTIILQVLLLVFFYSLPIRDIIQISLFTLNAILLPSEPATSLQILMNYKILSKLKFLQSNSVIKYLLMHNISLLLISKQVTKSLLRLSSSESLSLQKSFPKNISNPIKLFSSLVYYHSPSVSQSPCTLSIQFIMCLYLNMPYPTLSPREYNWPLLQL